MSFEGLLRWYERVRRPLPWRAPATRTRCWSSEVMLQQTQAARWSVLRALPRALPGRGSARAAPRRRAPRLERARLQPPRAALQRGRARSSPSAAGPTTSTELPGVGPYTAAAVGVVPVGSRTSRRSTRTCAACSSRRDGVEQLRGRLRAGGPSCSRAARGAVEPGDDGARRDGLPAAAPALAAGCPLRERAALRRRAAQSARARPSGERFEATRAGRAADLAALVAGEQRPLAVERRERADAGLLARRANRARRGRRGRACRD